MDSWKNNLTLKGGDNMGDVQQPLDSNTEKFSHGEGNISDEEDLFGQGLEIFGKVPTDFR